MQNFDYLYNSLKTTRQPKTYMDWYKNYMPFMTINKRIMVQTPKELFDPATAYALMETQFDFFNQETPIDQYTESQQSQMEEFLKDQMFSVVYQDIEMLNTKLNFLLYYYYSKTTSIYTGDFALTPTQFFLKCKEGLAGINIIQIDIKDGDGNVTGVSYRIFLDDNYRYYYANKGYLTIGNIGEYLFTDTEERIEFEHFIMKYHLLADAEGRKEVNSSNNPLYPDLSTSLPNLLPPPNNGSVDDEPDPAYWEYSEEYGGYISKHSATLTGLLGSYSSRNGVLLGFNSITDPIIRCVSETATSYITDPFYYNIAFFASTPYLWPKFGYGLQIFSNTYVENRRDVSRYFDENGVRVFYVTESNMSTFHHAVLYL